MSFTPLVRYRNFNLENFKSLLAVYPDMVGCISWDEAKDIIEGELPRYKRTAYQQACQLGLEDRSKQTFQIQNYLYTFSDNNLIKYLEFWFKTYFAPNPYVKSDDEPILLYCQLCEDILNSDNHSIKFQNYVDKHFDGQNKDILLNAIKNFAQPVKCSKNGNDVILYIDERDILSVEKEISYIRNNFPVRNAKSKHEFFERYSYENFCKFYGNEEYQNNRDELTITLPFSQSKECARKIVNCIYDVDKFERIADLFHNNQKNIRIDTGKLGGNYLRYIFAKESSDLYHNNTRVFIDREYEIPVNDTRELCRLSNQWVSTEFSKDNNSSLNLKALINIVNNRYKDVINIYQKNEKWYLCYLKKKFNFSNLPESFDRNFIKRYINSLVAKRFVILTGNSGTGKTRIAKQLGQFLEKKINGNANWIIVPVGADWTDNTKIFGFYNPLEEKYLSTPTLDFILQAAKNPKVPHFLILDEMNLSHVERYFADFLSAMESDEEILLYKSSKVEMDSKKNLEKIPEKIKLPRNLFVTGTVNIDETTYMFSPKVLDRANVIEFIPNKLDVLSLITGGGDKNNVVSSNFDDAETFLSLCTDISDGVCKLSEDNFEQIKLFLDGIYDILQEAGFEFAYRTVKEIRQYFAAAFELKEKEFNIIETLDEQIVQKILPKIYGDKKQIGKLLDGLEAKCSEITYDDTSVKMSLSLNKIKQMKNKLDRYQFASFI